MSVLGPKVYCMYSKPVGDIIQKHKLTYHCYADDTQVYITFKTSSDAWNNAISKIEMCLQDMKDWMPSTYSSLMIQKQN